MIEKVIEVGREYGIQLSLLHDMTKKKMLTKGEYERWYNQLTYHYLNKLPKDANDLYVCWPEQALDMYMNYKKLMEDMEKESPKEEK